MINKSVNKEKICFVIHSLGIGGMERVMSLIITHIAQKSNVETHLVLIGFKRELVQSIPNETIVHKPSWVFDNSRRTWCTLKTFKFIRGTIKQINPDSILSFGEMWNNLVLLALMVTGCPIYISDRSRPNKDLGRFQNYLRDTFYPIAKGFVAQTEKGKDVAIQRNWNTNISVIGNPVPKINGESKRKPYILNVGRLIQTKNIDQLLEIFSSVSKDPKHKEWRLKIVGGDAHTLRLSEKLKQQADQLSITERVDFEGEQKNVVPYYLEGEIFAFTSTSEGFPNALAEAMSAGMAVIAYDCIAGPSDLIDDGVNGFLIPENNKALFAQKLKELISDLALRVRFGQAAKVKMQSFEATQLCERFYDFIKPV